jgi:hypothetical protein
LLYIFRPRCRVSLTFLKRNILQPLTYNLKSIQTNLNLCLNGFSETDSVEIFFHQIFPTFSALHMKEKYKLSWALVYFVFDQGPYSIILFLGCSFKNLSRPVFLDTILTNQCKRTLSYYQTRELSSDPISPNSDSKKRYYFSGLRCEKVGDWHVAYVY